MNWDRRLAVLLTAIVAAIALVACAPPGQVIGDSISVPIPATKAVHIDASGGRTTYSAGHGPAQGSGLDAVRRLASTVKIHGWVIIELGANDVAVAPDTNTYLRRVYDLVSAVPGDRCVAFLTVYRPAYQARVDAWNRTVRAILRQRPCFHVVEWQAMVMADPALIGADRLHPTDKGERALFLTYQNVAALPWGQRG